MSSASRSTRSPATSSARAKRAATSSDSGPTHMVRSWTTLSTSSWDRMTSRSFFRISGRADAPSSSPFVFRPRPTATYARRQPIRMAAPASKAMLPVSSCSPTPTAAMTMPTTAALSSSSTVFTVGSGLMRTNSSTRIPASPACRRVWR